MAIGGILKGTTLAAGLVAAALGSAMLPTQSIAAGTVSISGDWAGTGSVVLKEGKSERVRCRVHYGRIAGQDFSLNARCASGSGRVDQTGVLKRVATNRYVGDVHNAQFNVRARVVISVSGQRQTVKISSSAGSATLRLKRR